MVPHEFLRYTVLADCPRIHVNAAKTTGLGNAVIDQDEIRGSVVIQVNRQMPIPERQDKVAPRENDLGLRD
jgi:hypothetical protein